MVSFFGLKLGGGGAAPERKIKPDEPLGQDDFFDSMPLPMPPARPGTSHSQRGGSPYGNFGASSSLADLRPSVARPSTADPAAANEPRPGLIHPSTWPRTAKDGSQENNPPARTKHGSSSSISLSLAPAAAAGAMRPAMSSPVVVQKKVRVNHLEVLSCRDAAAAAIQAPARSPLGQFEFHLRQRQNAASPRIETTQDYGEHSIVPVIEDVSYSRPSSPAPNKSLPPTPSQRPQTPTSDARLPTRAKAPSNLREVDCQTENSDAGKRPVPTRPLRSPPQVSAADPAAPRPMPKTTTVQPPLVVLKQGPPSMGGGRRRSIETDFMDPNPPVFSDEAPETSNREGGLLGRPPPIGGDIRARSSSPRRGPGPSPMPPPGRPLPGGRRPPPPGPGPAHGRPIQAFRPSPGSGPRPHGPPPNGPPPNGLAGQKPADMPPPLRLRTGSGSKPQGDRVLPRMGPPAPRPGPGPAPRRLGSVGPDANAGVSTSNNASPTYGPGQGPVLSSGPGPALRPSPIPAPLRTGTFGAKKAGAELTPVTPVEQFQALGTSICASPASVLPDSTIATAPASHPKEIPPTPTCPTSPLLNRKDAQTPKASDESRDEDRFSMTSSLYSSDSEGSTPGRGEIRRDSNGWIVEHGSSDFKVKNLPLVHNNIMGFDFGFSV